jgi:hypothetical protein
MGSLEKNCKKKNEKKSIKNSTQNQTKRVRTFLNSTVPTASDGQGWRA